MMRKGIAVPYIIAILLGVGVIGLVGYWLFISGGQFGGASSKQQCENKFSLWCSQWGISGYNIGWVDSDIDPALAFNKKYPECATFGLIAPEVATPTVTNVNEGKVSCAAK